MALGPYRVEWAHKREEHATADFSLAEGMELSSEHPHGGE